MQWNSTQRFRANHHQIMISDNGMATNLHNLLNALFGSTTVTNNISET